MFYQQIPYFTPKLPKFDFFIHQQFITVFCLQEGYTPAHLAAYHGKTDVLAALIAAGANINAVDKVKQ